MEHNKYKEAETNKGNQNHHHNKNHMTTNTPPQQETNNKHTPQKPLPYNILIV